MNSARYPAWPKQFSLNFVLGEDKAREMGSACKYFPNKFGFGMIYGETAVLNTSIFPKGIRSINFGPRFFLCIMPFRD